MALTISKTLEWFLTKDSKPHTYKTGNWDGKNSDQVVAMDNKGKIYIAHFCQGVMDGSEFEEWYDNHDWLIEQEIVKYLILPD